MATPKSFTRLTELGLSGTQGTVNNSQDSYIKTFEFPVVAVASAAAQDTGIKAPKTIQAIGAYLKVKTPEGTAATKTVSVGIVGAAASFLSAEDVSVATRVGTPVTAVRPNDSLANFAYTLAGADFVELDAICVLTVIASDE